MVHKFQNLYFLMQEHCKWITNSESCYKMFYIFHWSINEVFGINFYTFINPHSHIILLNELKIKITGFLAHHSLREF